jgi:hypothetical protein
MDCHGLQPRRDEGTFAVFFSLSENAGVVLHVLRHFS